MRSTDRCCLPQRNLMNRLSPRLETVTVFCLRDKGKKNQFPWGSRCENDEETEEQHRSGQKEEGGRRMGSWVQLLIYDTTTNLRFIPPGAMETKKKFIEKSWYLNIDIFLCLSGWSRLNHKCLLWCPLWRLKLRRNFPPKAHQTEATRKNTAKEALHR